jgi:membrane protease YdiL (CAAX protease family)
LATAAAFGLIHLDWAQSSAAFALGIYLGWLAERLSGIRPTMLAHVANNSVFVLLSSPGAEGETSRGQSAAVLAGGALVCAAAVAFLRSDRAVRPGAALQEPSSAGSRAAM